jgi:hypothetical protein
MTDILNTNVNAAHFVAKFKRHLHRLLNPRSNPILTNPKFIVPLTYVKDPRLARIHAIPDLIKRIMRSIESRIRRDKSHRLHANDFALFDLIINAPNFIQGPTLHLN